MIQARSLVKMTMRVEESWSDEAQNYDAQFVFVEEGKLVYKAKLGGDNYEKQDAKQAEIKF